MPQHIELSQIVPFAGVACSLVLNFFNKPHHIVNQQTLQHEIHVLPWVLQINFGIAYLLYSQSQGDVFLFVQAIPLLMNGLSHTLHWHPFYNKRLRKLHEYLLFFALIIVLITNAATTVYFQNANKTVQQIGSGVPVVIMAVFTTATLGFEKWRLLSTTRPQSLEVLVCGAGFFGSGLWTAYGFYGVNEDWVVCTSSILWLVFSVCHGLMILYGMAYNGGVDMGWETDIEGDDDSDMVVDRFNREPTIDGYPPMMGDTSFGGGSSSNSRMSMGRGGQNVEMMDRYSEDFSNGPVGGNPRSRRGMRDQQGYAPEFLVNEQ
ncbi:UNVERIFIED_CONTAM: hypothetical protein HDU68_006567 [Siphonaria sp. JEL0065]|nr:hypothetical protein HDU68_006567 [Siphonaria sp. JEL0065]